MGEERQQAGCFEGVWHGRHRQEHIVDENEPKRKGLVLRLSA